MCIKEMGAASSCHEAMMAAVVTTRLLLKVG